MVPTYELLVPTPHVRELIEEGQTTELAKVVEGSTEDGVVSFNRSLSGWCRSGSWSWTTPGRLRSPGRAPHGAPRDRGSADRPWEGAGPIRRPCRVGCASPGSAMGPLDLTAPSAAASRKTGRNGASNPLRLQTAAPGG